MKTKKRTKSLNLRTKGKNTTTMIEYLYVISWLFTIEVIGLITYPIVSFMCGNVHDKGYSISKILGLVLLTFISWILALFHICRFGSINVLISIFLLILLSVLIIYHNKIDMIKLLKENKNIIIKSELVFIAAFIIFLIIFSKNPNISYAYSEDFMDYGFIKSILRTEYLPPSDIWYAGTTLPYYYGVHLIIAILTLLSNVPTFISYNLGGVMNFSLAALASFGIGYNLTKSSFYGILTALFVTFIGFFSGFLQLSLFLFPDLGTIIEYRHVDVQNILEWFRNYPFYEINRIIPYSLVFYNGSVLLQGDIHGNVISITFQVAFISYLYGNIVKGTFFNTTDRFNQNVKFLILGIFLGFFILINPWNYPTYVFFTGFVIILTIFKNINSKKAFVAAFSKNKSILLKYTLIIGFLSFILYSPHIILSSSTSFSGIGLIGGKTEMLDLLEIFLLFIFIMVTFMWFLFQKHLSEIIGIILLSFILAWLSGFQILIIMIPLILISAFGIVTVANNGHENIKYILLLIITGALLCLFCEFFYVNDAYGFPYHRMNTLLKIYAEIWIFFGIASACSLHFILRDFSFSSIFKNRYNTIKTIWVLTVIFLIVASTISPLAMSLTLTNGKKILYGKPPDLNTLNGLDYLVEERPWDMSAIAWIEENIDGNHIILEAPGDAYTYSSRVSALTGLSTVIGWISHERAWRGYESQGNIRRDDTDLIYNTTDNNNAIELLEKYNVEFIFIGELEIEKYSDDGLQKFSDHPEYYMLIYENEGVSIYEFQ